MKWLVNKCKKLNCFKMNNSGAAMVTMIVVVLFVTILATTLLYVSGMNFQIKQTDYRNTKSFYSGETNLEKMKMQFTEDASDAALLAYDHTMAQYVALGDSTAREWTYYQKFTEEIEKEWDANSGGDWRSWLGSSYFLSTGATLTINATDTNGDGKLGTTEVVEFYPDQGYCVVKGIQVTYTNTNGYTSIITTDFYVEAPRMNWNVDASATAAPADASELEAQEINVSECVEYVNWQKQ